MPVTYPQLCLGTELEVPLIKGKRTVTVPPGTQVDESFRLAGHGVPDPHGGPRGDLFVQLRLDVPRKLDEDHEKLLRDLADHEHAHVSAHRKGFLEKLKDYFTGDEENS